MRESFGIGSFEKREFSRCRLNLPMFYTINKQETAKGGESVDISRGGLMAYLNEQFQPGDRLHIEIFFPNHFQLSREISINSFRAQAQVMWVSFDQGNPRGEWKYGMKIVDISREDSVNLRQILDYLSSSPL